MHESAKKIDQIVSFLSNLKRKPQTPVAPSLEDLRKQLLPFDPLEHWTQEGLEELQALVENNHRLRGHQPQKKENAFGEFRRLAGFVGWSSFFLSFCFMRLFMSVFPSDKASDMSHRKVNKKRVVRLTQPTASHG